MTTTSGQILKTDVLGRVQTPGSRREQLLDEFERSGLSGVKFAQVVGIKYTTLASWVQARRKKRGDYSKPKTPGLKKTPVRWLEAVVEPKSQQSAALCLVIQLPDGARMELYSGTQASMAAQLLKLLQKAPAKC